MTATIFPFPARDEQAFDRRVSELEPRMQRLLDLLECPIEEVPTEQRILVEVVRAGMERKWSGKGAKP